MKNKRIGSIRSSLVIAGLLLVLLSGYTVARLNPGSAALAIAGNDANSSPEPAADVAKKRTVCEMVAGGTYIGFPEGTFAGIADAASPRRITFGNMQPGQPGQVLGKGKSRMLLSAPPIAGHASCRFGKEKGGNNKEGTSVCDAYATQYIENTTCNPVIFSQGVFAFGSSATLFFTSEGGDAGSVTLSTSDNGRTLWAETTVQKGQDTFGAWLLRLPSPPRGRPLKLK